MLDVYEVWKEEALMISLAINKPLIHFSEEICSVFK